MPVDALTEFPASPSAPVAAGATAVEAVTAAVFGGDRLPRSLR
jgi:hypothetical protein